MNHSAKLGGSVQNLKPCSGARSPCFITEKQVNSPLLAHITVGRRPVLAFLHHYKGTADDNALTVTISKVVVSFQTGEAAVLADSEGGGFSLRPWLLIPSFPMKAGWS